MLVALADCPDRRVAGSHSVVHHDAAVGRQPSGPAQRRLRADADGNHHHASGDAGAVREADGARLDRGRAGVGDDGDPLPHQALAQQPGGAVVELAVHQPGVAVQHRHRHAALGQPGGGLQPQQPAADHHRRPARARPGDHAAHVFQGAVGEDVRQVGPRHAQAGRLGAGREHESLVAQRGAVLQGERPGGAVDGGDPRAGAPIDAVPGQHLGAVGDEAALVEVAGQQRAERDPVVGMRGLGPQQGDGGPALRQALGASHASRPGAHDDDALRRLPHALPLVTTLPHQSNVARRYQAFVHCETACLAGDRQLAREMPNRHPCGCITGRIHAMRSRDLPVISPG